MDLPSGDAREGLEDLLRDGTFEQMGSTEEMEIISGVMQFGEKTVADVMTRREDIFALSNALAPEVMAREIAASGYSRVPIYHDSLDSIAGMLHVFDVFAVGGTRVPGLRPMARTSPLRPATELLFDLLRSRRQVAIVANDTGHTVGLVTMEDLLEELVGEIRDEHDEPGPTDVRGERL
jgi:putative hemolysin